MKTKDELNTLKGEVEALGKKLAELNEEELKQVTGGFIPPYPPASFSEAGGNDTYFDLYDIFEKLSDAEKEAREKAEALRETPLK